MNITFESLIIVATFVSKLIVFKILFLSFLLILNVILFLIPYKIDRTLIKNPLSNVKSIENISN